MTTSVSWCHFEISLRADPPVLLQHASADVGLMFAALNLRRIFNILPQNVLQAYLRGLARIFSPLFALLRVHSLVLMQSNSISIQSAILIEPRLQLIKMRYIRRCNGGFETGCRYKPF